MITHGIILLQDLDIPRYCDTMNLLPNFVQLLESNDDEIVLSTLECLGKLFKVDMERGNQIVSERLKISLNECGGIQKIEKLQEYKYE